MNVRRDAIRVTSFDLQNIITTNINFVIINCILLVKEPSFSRPLDQVYLIINVYSIYACFTFTYEYIYIYKHVYTIYISTYIRMYAVYGWLEHNWQTNS
jgi:hypothetical protein